MHGDSLQGLLAQETPLQIVGTINAYSALLAKHAGFKAIYLSGSGVASSSYGLPDLGITNLDDVLIDVNRITYACDLPLLVDIDTGWGSAFNIARAIKSLIRAGAKAAHIEDQVAAKRCGHRPKKALVSCDEMCDRIKAAIDAKTDDNFMVMARTDALSVEGLDQTLERVKSYEKAGADSIFLEGAKSLEDYRHIKQHCPLPLLANLTEFGVTPLFTREEMQEAGVDFILYPLSANRAMNKAALAIYETIRTKGSQQSVLNQMQTRDELYQVLNYHHYEEKLDELFSKGKEK